MIPLSVPHLNGNELKYVESCITSGWISSAGDFVNQFEQSIRSFTKAKYSIACMNGTAGLHLALLSIGVNTNDLILTTNLTFVATLNSIAYTGAEPILFDVKEDTWQIDLDLVELWLAENTELIERNNNLISIHKTTKQKIAAIVPVHVLGGLVDINKLLEISNKYAIPVIEDSTEALGSTFKGQAAGTFGLCGVYSFNGNKIISTGGGGMVMSNCDWTSEKIKHLSTTAKVDSLNYFHNEVGYNYRLVNVLAAIGLAQIEQIDKILKKKEEIDIYYKKQLGNLEEVQFQKHHKDSKPNNWLFTFRSGRSKELITYLNKLGIQSRPFWTPMNRLPMHKNLKYITNLNNTEKIFSSALSIPCSSNLTQEQQDRVVSEIFKLFKK